MCKIAKGLDVVKVAEGLGYENIIEAVYCLAVDYDREVVLKERSGHLESWLGIYYKKDIKRVVFIGLTVEGEIVELIEIPNKDEEHIPVTEEDFNMWVSDLKVGLLTNFKWFSEGHI